MPKIQNQIKFYKYITNAGILSLAILLLLTLNILIPINFKSETAVATDALTSTTSLTLDVASSTAGVELLVTSDSGTFASTASGDEMSFNVTTNNVTGYMLSISAKFGTDLTNSAAGTSFASLDATNSTAAAGITADTFGNAANTTYNNMWGFKPNYYKSTANSDKFYPSPTTSGVTLNKTESANTNADTYTIAIGARATYSQVAGAYSNTYILSAVGNYPKYSITYADNSGDSTVSGLPDEQSANPSSSTAVTLSSTIPTRTGYGFDGWCTQATTSSGTACPGTLYPAEAEYVLDTTSANSITLYATWYQVAAMQNLDPSLCVAHNARTFIDSRDSTSYAVQRLADGKCWFLDNLALDLTDATVKANLSSLNTNASNSDIKYLLSGGGTASDQYATAGVAQWGSSNSFTAPLIDVANKSEAAIYAFGVNGQGKIGAFYNVCAATAGTYCYASTEGDAPTSDICPVGWHLATGGKSGEFQTLYSYYDDDVTAYISDLRVILTGFYSDGSVVRKDAQGHIWSSTPSGAVVSYALSSTASSLSPSAQGRREYGGSLRCVMNEATYSIAYNANASGDAVDNMPDNIMNATASSFVPISSLVPSRAGYIFAGWCASSTQADGSCSGTAYYAGDTIGVSNGDTTSLALYAIWATTDKLIQNVTTSTCTTTSATTVYDSRDGRAYSIQRLADGRCWLLDNLALDLTNPVVQAGLSSQNTNATDTEIGYLLNGGGTSSDQYAIDGVALWPRTHSFSQPLIAKDGVTNGAKWNADDTVTWAAGIESIDGKTGGKIGIYYNICAATAGTYCYGDGSSNWGTPSGDATADICPSGWRMPTTSNSDNNPGSYYSLYNKSYSADVANFVTALRLPLTGYYVNGLVYIRGDSGHFWASSRYDGYRMYFLNVNSSSVRPANYYSRAYGHSVRCVMQETINSITYMQDINSDNKSSIMDSMELNKQYQLIDNRDNKKYYVAKLAMYEDNLTTTKYAIWMTQNLDLCIGCSAEANNTGVATAALTSKNTDINPNSTQSMYSTSDSSTGYSVSNGVTTWTPASTAITTNHMISGASVENWTDSRSEPYSAEGGDIYIIPSGNADDDTVSSTCPLGEALCPHYYRGNFYNWTAAIASNNSSSLSATYSNADNSICPSGWKLPYGTDKDGTATHKDFGSLLYRNGITDGLSGKYTDAGIAGIRSEPLYFVRGANAVGNYHGGVDSVGKYGRYWSSTINGGSHAWNFIVNPSGRPTPSDSHLRAMGFQVRCLVR